VSNLTPVDTLPVALAVTRIARLDAAEVRTELPWLARRVTGLSAAALIERRPGERAVVLSVSGLSSADPEAMLRDPSAVRFPLGGGSGLVLAVRASPEMGDEQHQAIEALCAATGLAMAAEAARTARTAAGEAAEVETRRRMELTFELAEVRQAERDLISARVHDGAQQTVTSVALVLDGAVAELEKASEVAPALRLVTIARDRARDAIRQMRQLYEELDDDHEGSDSLTAASFQIADRFGEAHGVRFRIDVRAADAALVPNERRDAFAIVREAVVNAVKHARPSVVSIVATPGPGDALTISVGNDGEPMRGRRSSDGRGQGLTAMSERAGGRQWDLSWESQEAGTVVRLVVPLRAD
jgi:signal transduction histidine kinase